MQTQQSQSETQTQTQDTTARQPAEEQVQAGGNQAAVEEAGLDGGGSDDYSLSGPFAGLLLDVMPLAAALSAAAEFISNPAVQEWIRAVSDEALMAVALEDGDLVGFLLDAIVPAGTGVELTGEMALGLFLGADFSNTVQMLRTEDNTLHLECHPAIKVGVSGGEGGKVVDAFGNGVEATAGGEAYAAIQADGALDVVPSAAGLLKVLGASASDIIIHKATGERMAATGPDAAAPLLEGVEPDWAVGLDVGAKGEARAQVPSVRELPGPLAGPAQAVLDLAGLAFDASAVAEVTGLVHGTVQIQDECTATFAAEGTTGALAEASASFSMVLGGEQIAALDAMAGFDCGLAAKLELSFDATQISQGLAEVTSTALELTVSGGVGAAATTEGADLETETSSTTMRFDSIFDARDTLFGQVNTLDGNGCEAIPGTEAAKPLTELLVEAGGGPAITETHTVTLDPSRFAGEIGRWADLLGVDDIAEGQRSGGISTDSELLLSGEIAVTPDDYARAAATGIEIQGDAGRFVAWRDLATAIHAARGAGTTPAWLAPWAAELEGEFGADAPMTNVRLKGFVGVGAGGEAAGAMVAEVEGKVAGTARYIVDKAATEDDLQRLLDAV